MHRRALGIAVFAWATMTATVAAQEADDETTADETTADETTAAPEDEGRDAQARALFEAGRVAFDNGRYEEALQYFRDCYALSERAGILYNIGHAAQLLSREREALDAYERYLAAEPDAANRAAVESRIRALRESVEAEEQEASAQAGGETAASTADASAVGQDAGASGGASIGGWVTFGGGVAATGVGVVMLILAGSAASSVTDVADGTPWVDVESDYDAAGTFSIVGGVLLGVGLAAAAAGLVWVIAGGGDDETQVAFTPGGVLVRGTL